MPHMFRPLDRTVLKLQSSNLHRKKAQTIGYQMRGFLRPYTTSKGPKMAAEFWGVVVVVVVVAATRFPISRPIFIIFFPTIHFSPLKLSDFEKISSFSFLFIIIDLCSNNYCLYKYIFFQKIVKKLGKETKTSEVQEYTTETLEYLKGRENLWKNQTEQIGFSKNKEIDFSSNDKLQMFYEKETLVVYKH